MRFLEVKSIIVIFKPFSFLEVFRKEKRIIKSLSNICLYNESKNGENVENYVDQLL